MAPKKIRCNAKECREAAQRIVGDCGFCNGHFCGKHRLLEDHKCSGLEDVSRTHLLSPFAGFGSLETCCLVSVARWRRWTLSQDASLTDRPLGLPRRCRNQSPGLRHRLSLAVTITQGKYHGLGRIEVLTSQFQCKKQSHERNAAQLESERTQVIRGV